ncbi:MAG: Ig-like domain-containing protein [Eubacteriales bacterium]|nr:Ig-like domain-containing protein [Eubacteriales bacterium]
MKKRILAALLLAAMCSTACFPATAAAALREKEGASAAVEPFSAADKQAERQVLNFNKDWRFQKGEVKDAGQKEFDDSDWRMLNLPHDYSIENDFDPASSGKSGGGYLDGGPAWYRKTWVVPAEMAGKRISVDFEGVYMNSSVYVNGTLIGNYPYGYSPFSYDITDHVVADGMTENVIAVYTNNEQPSSRWYSGSGIYRDVTMTVTEPVHIARYGTYVTTPDLEQEYTGGKPATVHVETKVENESGAAASVTVRHNAYYKGSLKEMGSDEPVAVVTSEPVSVAAGATEKVDAKLSVSAPHLWEVGVGGMYALQTEILIDGVVKDTYDTDFGLRWMDFSHDGFFLNGKYTKMRGVCQHHDQGALGAVNNQAALDRQMRILREMGVNSIRSSHNPASRALLNSCNEQGIMVMNEAFDTWFSGKNDYDFHLFFDKPCTHPDAKPGQTWQEFDIKNMVEDAKNDPAVIMWSIGNEISEAWDAKGRETGMKLAEWVREIDDSGRAVTQADPLFGPLDSYYFDPKENSDHWQLIDNNDATGFNYGAYTDYDIAHNLNPDWFVYSSETASAVATRGEYYHPWIDDDSHAGDASHGGKNQCSEFDNDRVAWGTTLHYALKEDAKRKYLGGVFFWTGFDYTGEPAPFAGANQAKSSYFGAIDTCGFPKDSFYLLQSQWLDVKTDPMVHILPHWNWESDESIEINGKMPIRIYSNAPTVEVFLNGTSLGKQSFTQHPETATSLAYQTDGEQENLYLQWLVDYAPGTVEAVAYDANGREVARDVKATAGAPAAIRMTPEAPVITADGEDLSYIAVDVVDENGVVNPRANNNIQFSISGNGRIVGTDNGNPLDWTNMKSKNRSAFNGKALVIVQSTNQSGAFTLTASSAGLPLSSTTVYTEPAAGGADGEILGYDPVLIKTLSGVQPELPQTVAACYADGSKTEKAVIWETVSGENLTKAGYIIVNGTVTETGAAVKATVEVVAPVGVRPVSAVTQPGTQPVLPETVQLVNSDGTEAAYPVTWDVIDKDKLVENAAFIVNGTLTGMSGCTASAHIRVSNKTSSVNQALASNGGTFEAYVNEANYDPLQHINDGIISYNTDPKNGWGNWCGVGVTPHETETVTCTMSATHTVSSVTLHFREDGGIYIPSDTLIQYWNGEAWADVSNQSARNGFRGGVGSEITFDPITTNKIRATFTRGEQDTSVGKKDCVVITEFQIFEKMPDTGSSTAALSSVTVNGEPLEGFSPDKTAYTVTLPFGGEIPVVAAAGADHATVLVLPAISGNSAASIQVTSEDGSRTKTYTVQFTETPAAIASAVLRLEQESVTENDVVTIRADATLEDGTLADEELLNVKYSLSGAGIPAKAEIKAGRLYAYQAGEVTVQASIGYLSNARVNAAPLTVTIQPSGDKKSILSYAAVNVTTSKGVAPVLPAVVKAKFDLGLAQDVAVIWDEIDPSQYARYGKFTVSGTVPGQALRPTATVLVRDAVAAQNQSMATPIGMAPILPKTVPVYASDGTSTVSAVAWDEYDPNGLKQEGTITINGVTELEGLPVTMSLRVTNDAIQSKNYAQLWTGFSYPMAFADFTENDIKALNNGKEDKWCSWGNPDGQTFNIGVVFGADYPESRYIDTVDLSIREDTTWDKTGIDGCTVQYYKPEFTLADMPKKPGNMLDASMSSNPLNNDENWADVENQSNPEFAYGSNIISFDMVNTYALRLKLTKKGSDPSYYLCLNELYAYGKSPVTHNDFAVSGIAADGTAIADFDPATKAYAVPVTGTAVPALTAAVDRNAAVTVLPAPNIDGESTVLITSEDGLKQITYHISFVSDTPRYQVSVKNGTAYRAVASFAEDGKIVEKYAEGEGVTVVADEPADFQAFDKWVSSDLELTAEQAAQNPMTFKMPGKDVLLAAVYKERLLTDAEAVAAAKQRIGTGVEVPYAVYTDEIAKAKAATIAAQALIGKDVTAAVLYVDGVFALTLVKNDAGATVKPFEVTVAEKTEHDGSSGGGKPSKPEDPTKEPEPPVSRPSQEFADTKTHWAALAIDYVVENNLFNGISATKFGPDEAMTRAMLMTVLARADGQDTAGGSTWYEKGMNWAMANGISDGSNPNGNITREQLVTMLYRYAGSPDVPGMVLGEFVDKSDISGFAADAMLWAAQNKIVTGKSGNLLDPQGKATRAEVATMLMRFMQKK